MNYPSKERINNVEDQQDYGGKRNENDFSDRSVEYVKKTGRRSTAEGGDDFRRSPAPASGGCARAKFRNYGSSSGGDRGGRAGAVGRSGGPERRAGGSRLGGV